MFFFPLWPISVWILFCFLQLTELCQSFYHLLRDFHMHLWNSLKMSNWQFFMCFAHRGGPWIVHLQHALPPNEKALDSGYLAPVVLPKVHTIGFSNFCCKLLSVSCDCTQSTGTAKVVNISVLTRSSACYQGYVCVVLSHLTQTSKPSSTHQISTV